MRLEVRKKQRGVYGHSLDEMKSCTKATLWNGFGPCFKGEGTGLGDVWGRGGTCLGCLLGFCWKAEGSGHHCWRMSTRG